MLSQFKAMFNISVVDHSCMVIHLPVTLLSVGNMGMSIL